MPADPAATRVAARLAAIARVAVAQAPVELDAIKAPPELRAVVLFEVSRAAMVECEKIREDGRG